MILMIGSNMTEAHPVAATFVKDAVLGGAELIVVDPRRTDLVDFAQLHVPIKVGSDVALINGVMNVLISENLYDKKYVESCTIGFEELKKKVMEYPPERAAEISGISADTIRDAGPQTGFRQTGHADVHAGHYRTYLRREQRYVLRQSPDASGQCRF